MELMRLSRACATSLIAALVVVGCATVPRDETRVPSADEAEEYLAEVVELAKSRDFEALCARGGGNCEQILETAGRDAVPTDAPRLVDMVILPDQELPDGSVSTGGQLLTVCGTLRTGEAYQSQMLIFDPGDGQLIAIEPVYWSGLVVAPRYGTSQHPPQGCVDPSRTGSRTTIGRVATIAA